MSEELAVQDHTPALRSEMTVGELVGQVKLIQEAMSAAMKDGEHYGVIPGTDKPTLLKPGAEKLCLLFRLDPEYESTERWEGEHYTVTAICRLFHIPTGNRVASGQGLCSTKESKYAYRNAKRVCPLCGEEQIIKGKTEFGGGWLCWKKKGGCGAKYQDGDPAIEGQDAGQKPNENLPDTYNTVLKMACKRALVAAVLNGTAASDIFTQDIDDSDESGAGQAPTAAGGLLAPDDPGGGIPSGKGGGSPNPMGAGPSPDLLMTFGKYKGTRVGDLPRDYLGWLAGEARPMDGSDEPVESFVPDDEYGGQLSEAAKAALERGEDESRRVAIGTLSSALKHAQEHGSLPPGHKDWAAYLRWYIERYGIDPTDWRTALTPTQILEIAAHLHDQDIPL